MAKNDVLYFDKEGYEKYLEEIDKIKEELRIVNAGRKNAVDDSIGDDWNYAEFEDIESKKARLTSELNRRYDELSRIVIVEKHNKEDQIDIDDIVEVNMIFSEDDSEEMIFKLVGKDANLKAEIAEISINSPLGMSVYKKRVGETCVYTVGNRDVSVFIKSKFEKEHSKIKLR